MNTLRNNSLPKGMFSKGFGKHPVRQQCTGVLLQDLDFLPDHAVLPYTVPLDTMGTPVHGREHGTCSQPGQEQLLLLTNDQEVPEINTIRY